MSESYPYFSISRQFGVPYGEVLAIASRYERLTGKRPSLFKGSLCETVYSAVIAEKARREKVIQQSQ